jgi:bacterioferritin-associated ferredoxin
MLVCVCNGISDKQIDSELTAGSSSFKEIKSELGIGNCCGQCVPFAKNMVNEKITAIQASQNYHLVHEIQF